MNAFWLVPGFVAGAFTCRLITWRVIYRTREQCLSAGRAEVLRSMDDRLAEGYELLSGQNGAYWHLRDEVRP